MTRADYLNQLEQALFQLHPSARQEALDYFNEYFDEKDNDEEAIIELGTPDEAAKEIIANLPEDALITEKDQASPVHIHLNHLISTLILIFNLTGRIFSTISNIQPIKLGKELN